MKIKKSEYKIIISIIFALILIFLSLCLFSRRDKNLLIKENDLQFILEFDKHKQNEETDRFIKKEIETYFEHQGKTIKIMEVNYDLRYVSKGYVIKTKAPKLEDKHIKRIMKSNKNLSSDVYVDIENLDPKHYFIGQALSKEGHKLEFKYRVFDTDFSIIQSEKEYTFKLNSKEDFLKGISAKDNIEEIIPVEIVEDITWDKAGTYEVELRAIDSNGNESKVSVKLRLIDDVKEEDIKIEESIEIKDNTLEAKTEHQTEDNKQTEENKQIDIPRKEETSPSNDTIIAEYKPMPTAPAPQEDRTWKNHPKDFMGHDGVKMYFYKNYGNFETCHATMDDLLDEKAWVGDWNSGFCNDNGDMFYSTNGTEH